MYTCAALLASMCRANPNAEGARLYLSLVARRAPSTIHIHRRGGEDLAPSKFHIHIHSVAGGYRTLIVRGEREDYPYPWLGERSVVSTLNHI